MKARGEAAEDDALAYLRERGLHLVERNFRCRCGELDLVMRDAGELVVAEVRFRSHARFVGAAESVGWRKQRKLVLAAGVFLQRHPALAELPLRFDVVAVTPDARGTAQFEWIRDAFRPE